MGSASIYGSQLRLLPRRVTGAADASTVADEAVLAPRDLIMFEWSSGSQSLCQCLQLHLGRAHSLFDRDVVDQRILKMRDDDLAKLLVVVNEVAQQDRWRQRVD